MAKQTYTKDERKAQFLKAGLAMAKKEGIAKVSVAAVATKCGVTAPLVFHCFGTRTALQAAIKREAKKQGVKLAEPKATPVRKRSIAEVRAIKNKKPDVVKKIVAKKAAKKATARKPAATVKYPTQPPPAVLPPQEPKNSL